ncbi:MAG: acetate--CoA ligase family protein [Deltaproteobacteria bacterium]|nr:acetate--CoA ligase family protein [Deltaproteobacteria bacterium]
MKLHIYYNEITKALRRAWNDGRYFLLENEIYDLLSYSGSETYPKTLLVKKGSFPTERDLASIPGKRVVLKIVSPSIVHKTEVGGVRIVEKKPGEIKASLEDMLAKVPCNYAKWLKANPDLSSRYDGGISKEKTFNSVSDMIWGVLLCQYMPPDSEAFGNELIVSLRRTREFGMIITAGLGGTDTELYAMRFKKGQAVVSASTELVDAEAFLELFKTTIAYKKMAGLVRGQKRIVRDEQLLECFASFIEMGRYYAPGNKNASFVIDDLEINPFSFSNFLMIPLDGICRFSLKRSLPVSRPISKIDKLLHPSSIAIIGVSSSRMNFGRIILDNILSAGFDPSRLTIINKTRKEIGSIKCVPELASLDRKVDLFVVAVDASKVPEIVSRVIDLDAANSVMLIPGGLGEKKGSEERARFLKRKINSAHKKHDGGPVFLGGNCLGVISHPGRYDTLFIPEEKLPKSRGAHERNVAFISQSGAFMITRMSKHPDFDPKYLISIGNQTDITAGDIMSYMTDVEDIKVIGLYMEGFNDLDGLNLCRAIRMAVLNRKDVIFYKAGRTPEGKSATSSHTASLAGDYMVCESCVRQAGAIVAGDFTEFDDLFLLAKRLHDKQIKGARLAAVSGAGFEAVGMADSIQGEDHFMEMAKLNPFTKRRIAEVIREKHLEMLIDIKNPLDINPAADDEAHARISEILLEDPDVDGLVLGLDPLSPATKTLLDNTADEKNIAGLILDLFGRARKPLLGVVDGGPLYEPLINLLNKAGMPVFRSSSRAVSILSKYINGRLCADRIRKGSKTLS